MCSHKRADTSDSVTTELYFSLYLVWWNIANRTLSQKYAVSIPAKHKLELRDQEAVHNYA